MLGGSTRQRVSRLESSVEELRGDFGAMSGKIDKVLEQVSNTDGRAAQRAHDVKIEMREEEERKARGKSDLLKNALALGGFVALVVGAFGGPYLNKVNATADGQMEDTKAIAAVREVLAQQGGAIGRNGDSIDLSREKNRTQDAELREHDQDLSFLHGWMSARLGTPGR